MTEPPSDGRHARRVQNTRAIALAMLELMQETGEVPLVEAVAARAGVSRRSVFRLFKDVETLSRTAIDIHRSEVVARYMPPPLSTGSLGERLDILVEHRAALYEHITPFRLIAERRRAHEPIVEQDLREGRSQLRAHLERLFADLLPDDRRARRELVDALELATSWASWRVLRAEQRCGVARAKRVVRALCLGCFAADRDAG